MDQQKNQGQQNWDQTQNPNRDQAEGERQEHMPDAERTRGSSRSSER